MSIILGKGFWKRVCSRDRQYKEVLHLKSSSPRVWLKRCLWDKEAGWSEAQDGPQNPSRHKALYKLPGVVAFLPNATGRQYCHFFLFVSTAISSTETAKPFPLRALCYLTLLLGSQYLISPKSLSPSLADWDTYHLAFLFSSIYFACC